MTPERIDDPVEASFEAWPPDSPSLGDRLSNLTSSFGGIAFIPAAIFQILKDQFATESRFQRIEYLFQAMRLGFGRLQMEIGKVEEQVRAVNTTLSGERFHEAVAVACEEAARTVSKQKIKELAALLVGYAGPIPSTWAAPEGNIANMIRDLAQLGERDIHVLHILATVHASAIVNTPNLQDPHQFSKETPGLRAAIEKSGIHRDDFLSTCERLRGFGLAAEVLRNTSHMGPEDFCYRPTRRGLVLLDYLKNVSKVSQN